MTDWTDQDTSQAHLEGWSVFQYSDPSEPPFSISCVYVANVFSSDADVWQHVVTLASLGSGLHYRALLFLLRNSIHEFEDVMKHWTPPEQTDFWRDRDSELRQRLEAERV